MIRTVPVAQVAKIARSFVLATSLVEQLANVCVPIEIRLIVPLTLHIDVGWLNRVTTRILVRPTGCSCSFPYVRQYRRSTVRSRSPHCYALILAAKARLRPTSGCVAMYVRRPLLPPRTVCAYVQQHATERLCL